MTYTLYCKITFLVKSPNLLAQKLNILVSSFRMQSGAPSHIKLHPLNPMKARVVLKQKPQSYLQAEKK